jgi:hypothetical protein
MTKFRAVCESADCTPLLEKVQVGFLGSLDDVKRDGPHLTVKQNDVKYHFKVEADGGYSLLLSEQPLLIHVVHNTCTYGQVWKILGS